MGWIVSGGLDLFRRKKIRVRANDGANTAFLITPKELGYISIKVTATSALAGDSVDRKLLVKVIILNHYCWRFRRKHPCWIENSENTVFQLPITVFLYSSNLFCFYKMPSLCCFYKMSSLCCFYKIIHLYAVYLYIFNIQYYHEANK